MLSNRTGQRSKPRRCEFETCDNPTREGKPFCSDHVEHHRYVRELLLILDRRDAEIELIESADTRLKEVRRVDFDGPVVKEILHCIKEHGWLTMARLSRETRLSAKVLDACIRALVSKGALVTKISKRGLPAVRLARPPAKRRPGPIDYP